MTLREVRTADLPEVAQIWNAIIRDTTITFTTVEKTLEGLSSDIAAKQAEGTAFLVLEHAGKVQGFATYGAFRTGPGYRHTAEHTVYLAPDVQGRGFGAALLGAIEECARQRAIHSLIAGVGGENLRGIAFHRAMGYDEMARLPQVARKFDRWLDVVLLQKML